MIPIIKTAMIAVVGALACAGSAYADTLMSFDLKPTSQNAKGSYHVVLDVNSSFSSFSVVSIQANGGAPPNSNADRLTLAFYSGPNLTNPDPIVVSGTNGEVTPPGGLTGHWNGTLGADPNTWAFTGTAAGAVLKGGSNVFSTNGGTITLASAIPNGSIDVLLQDGNQWESGVNLVPEPTAAMMLLPGMLPIGLAFLRRRRRVTSG